MARYNRNRRVTYRPEPMAQEEEVSPSDGYLEMDSEPEPFYSNTIELFPEEEPVEEVTEPEITDISEPEPQKKGDEAAIAMKIIAGSYGATEEEIRSKLAEDGYSFEEVTDVKKRILNGTYYN